MPSLESDPTDPDLYAASRRYINSELARYNMNPAYFPFRLDTWYYQEDEEVGRMPLGEGPLTASVGILEFITAQLHAVHRGLTALLLPQRIDLDYMPSLDEPPMHTLYFGLDDLLAAPGGRLAELATFPHFVVSVWVRCAARVVLRDHAGELRDVWLPEAGVVRFDAEWSARYTPRRERNRHPVRPGTPPPVYPETPPAQVPWVASLHLNILSLFRPDNAARLALVRNEWKRLREDDPSATAFSEHPDDYYIVTLVDPPAGTPTDNRELQSLNAPRLRAAVAQWEQLMGRAFQWEAALE